MQRWTGRGAVIRIGSLGLCVVEAAIQASAAEVIAVNRSEVARETALEAEASSSMPLDRAGEVDAAVVFATAGASQAIPASCRNRGSPDR